MGTILSILKIYFPRSYRIIDWRANKYFLKLRLLPNDLLLKMLRLFLIFLSFIGLFLAKDRISAMESLCLFTFAVLLTTEEEYTSTIRKINLLALKTYLIVIIALILPFILYFLFRNKINLQPIIESAIFKQLDYFKIVRYAIGIPLSFHLSSLLFLYIVFKVSDFFIFLYRILSKHCININKRNKKANPFSVLLVAYGAIGFLLKVLVYFLLHTLDF